MYSVGCGLGGKLGHGSRTDEKFPRLIEQFRVLNLQPMVVAAGAWHAAVVGRDGRVCTWGWGRYGCLGHGNEECESVPKVVEALTNVKAVHVATGDYTTFVVSEEGDVYSFGCGESASLGHNAGNDDGQVNFASLQFFPFPCMICHLNYLLDFCSHLLSILPHIMHCMLIISSYPNLNDGCSTKQDCNEAIYQSFINALGPGDKEHKPI